MRLAIVMWVIVVVEEMVSSFWVGLGYSCNCFSCTILGTADGKGSPQARPLIL